MSVDNAFLSLYPWHLEKWADTEVKICMQSKLRLRFELEPCKGKHRWLVCIIGSHDYCHNPLGVGLFSMGNSYDKVACCLYTVCPTPHFEIIYYRCYKLCYNM